MRIVGSSAMSKDVLWRVSGPALEWRKRLSLRPALPRRYCPRTGRSRGEPGQSRGQGGPGQVVEGNGHRRPVGSVKNVRVPGV